MLGHRRSGKVPAGEVDHGREFPRGGCEVDRSGLAQQPFPSPQRPVGNDSHSGMRPETLHHGKASNHAVDGLPVEFNDQETGRRLT
jgi:hypothetical protein